MIKDGVKGKRGLNMNEAMCIMIFSTFEECLKFGFSSKTSLNAKPLLLSARQTPIEKLKNFFNS